MTVIECHDESQLQELVGNFFINILYNYIDYIFHRF